MPNRTIIPMTITQELAAIRKIQNYLKKNIELYKKKYRALVCF